MPGGQQRCFARRFGLTAFNGCGHPEVPVTWGRSRATWGSPRHGLSTHTMDSPLAPRTDPSRYRLSLCTTPLPASRSPGARPLLPGAPAPRWAHGEEPARSAALLPSVQTDTRPQPASLAPSRRSHYKEPAESAQHPQSPHAAEEQRSRALTVPVPGTSPAEWG